MSLVLRSNLNRKITASELDGNFTYLESLAQQSGTSSGTSSNEGYVSFPYSGTASFDGDFTLSYQDGLSFSTVENYNLTSPKILIASYINATYSFDSGIGNIITGPTLSGYNGSFEGSLLFGFGSLPSTGFSNYIKYDSSIISEALVKSDSSSLGGGISIYKNITGEFYHGTSSTPIQYNFEMSKTSDSFLSIGKINENGEVIRLAYTDTTTGLNIQTNLSDATADLFSIYTKDSVNAFNVDNSGNIKVSGATGVSGTFSNNEGTSLIITNGIITNITQA